MAGGDPILIVHRSANEIGGNCIEIKFDGHRLLLDAGSPLPPLNAPETTQPIPSSLDVGEPIDALVISHPHQDHYGLLRSLPPSWPVWCGAPTEILMRMTAAIRGDHLEQRFQNYHAWSAFTEGPFTITPYLTDHSAFDAHMLLVECGGKRILYSGDFRRVGRKAKLVDRFMQSPPKDIDVLILEGTTLGRSEVYPTEADLEEEFVSLFRRAEGRVFVTWSGQNIDRTVTIYRACLRSGRTLVLDLYTLDVLERLSALYDSLPRLGRPSILGVVTSSMKWLYESPDRMNIPNFVEGCAKSGHAIGAAKLNDVKDGVVMLRPSLLRDYDNKGMPIGRNDAWVFSMWSGYLKKADYMEIRDRFEKTGSSIQQIHTSGHASSEDLKEFADRLAPRFLVPIHSANWDDHIDEFPNVRRLQDGEPFVIS